MNNEQAARIAGVQSAARYFSNNPGSVEDIKLLASELAHYILTGETVMPQGHSEHQQEKHQVPAQQHPQEPDPHQELVMAFANRGHQAGSRSEVEKVMAEAQEAGASEGHLSMQGQRITLLNYLRECWKRLPREDQPEVIDPTRQDQPVNPGQNEALRSELNL